MTLIEYSPDDDVTYFGYYNQGGRFIREKGYVLITHAKDKCAGEWCSIHKPSDHPLKSAPLNWREDRRVMERVCEHGVGHNDPDDTAFRKAHDLEDADGVHGCDGCCWGGSY